MARRSTATRNGASLGIQSLYGHCADCDKPALLVGFICRRCYNRRNFKHRYATDKKYRLECMERSAQTRRRHEMKERKKKEGSK